MHALMLGLDHANVDRDIVPGILDHEVPLDVYVDMKTEFYALEKQGKTGEKHLKIDIHTLRQSYDRGELARVGWIHGKANPADAVTKQETSLIGTPLWDLMMDGQLRIHPIG